MKKLSGYTGVSLLAHALLILALVDVRLDSREDLSASDVYEVDIVTEAPSPGKAATASPGRQSPKKRYYYRKGSDSSSISDIRREKAPSGKAPELSPADLEPLAEPEPEQEEESPSPPAGTRIGGDSGALASGGSRLGTASAVLVWKTRVRTVVDGVWKTPPEISVVDRSLTTTYLLRISRSGELLDKKLLVSSGNGPFDRSVHLALSGVTRLPEPPLVLIAGRDSVEVTMSFTPPKGDR